MPTGPYDTGHNLLRRYKFEHINFVLMLVTDDELKKKARRNLLKLYEKQGIEVIRFPIADMTSPELGAASKVVDLLSGYLRAGAHVVAHCNAGVGRTGVMISCIARDLMHLSAQEAREHAQSHMQINLTDEQFRLIRNFKPLIERQKELSVTGKIAAANSH